MEGKSPQKTGQNRRQHPRFPIELHSALRLGDEDINAPTRDIGRGGICLTLDRPITPGEVVPLELSMALGTGPFSEALEVPARVVWCTRLGADHQLGLAFDDLTNRQIGELEMFLRFLQNQPTEALPKTPRGVFDTSDRDFEEDPNRGEDPHA